MIQPIIKLLVNLHAKCIVKGFNTSMQARLHEVLLCDYPSDFYFQGTKKGHLQRAQTYPFITSIANLPNLSIKKHQQAEKMRT